jgi:hypothetical protein
LELPPFENESMNPECAFPTMPFLIVTIVPFHRLFVPHQTQYGPFLCTVLFEIFIFEIFAVGDTAHSVRRYVSLPRFSHLKRQEITMCSFVAQLEIKPHGRSSAMHLFVWLFSHFDV